MLFNGSPVHFLSLATLLLSAVSHWSHPAWVGWCFDLFPIALGLACLWWLSGAGCGFFGWQPYCGEVSALCQAWEWWWARALVVKEPASLPEVSAGCGCAWWCLISKCQIAVLCRPELRIADQNFNPAFRSVSCRGLLCVWTMACNCVAIGWDGKDSCGVRLGRFWWRGRWKKDLYTPGQLAVKGKELHVSQTSVSEKKAGLFCWT